MTINPGTSFGNYDLLDQRGQEGISFSGEGVTTNTTRPRGPFGRAAEKPAQTATAPTATYDGQDLLGKFLINILLALTGALDPDKQGNNPLIGMIAKAFGFSDDANHTEFRQLREDVNTRGREAVRQERDYSRFDRSAAREAARMGEPVLGKNIYNSQVLELIGQHESGGDYNRVYGKAGRLDLSNMTLNQVVAWQKQYTDNGSGSSAIGKYQVIRTTLQNSMKEMGLTGNEKCTPEMQDKIALHLANKRGYTAFLEGRMSADTFANNMAKEWASFKTTTGRGAYDGDGLNTARVSAEKVVATALQDRTLQGSFASARDANPAQKTPVPPAADNPIVLADTAPSRRPPVPAPGLGVSPG